MAQFLRITNKSFNDRLGDASVSIKVPRGLSVESMLSRFYSISRGVISPKYVATEVALLTFRKKRAQALSAILQKPETVNAVIELLEQGVNAAPKIHARAQTAIITALASYEIEEKREKTKQQVYKLRENAANR